MITIRSPFPLNQGSISTLPCASTSHSPLWSPFPLNQESISTVRLVSSRRGTSPKSRQANEFRRIQNAQPNMVRAHRGPVHIRVADSRPAFRPGSLVSRPDGLPAAPIRTRESNGGRNPGPPLDLVASPPPESGGRAGPRSQRWPITAGGSDDVVRGNTPGGVSSCGVTASPRITPSQSPPT